MRTQPFKIELRKKSAPASDQALDRFERENDLAIPRDYRSFLRSQDGGAPVNRNFSFGRRPYRDSVLRHFLGVACPRVRNLSHFLKVYAGRLPERTFPVASDEFDNLILISQKRGATGQILFWDHEKELTSNRPALVARSLNDFLRMLKPDETTVYEMAVLTFKGGEVMRQVLPCAFESLDRKKVVQVSDLRVGERVNDFGVTRTLARVEYTTQASVR